jgi:4-phytase/acid phosphatase
MPPAHRDAHLQLVIVLSRHGVRPPLANQLKLEEYSAAPWPKWDVQAGYLTAHGFELMKFFGAWDREMFARDGLLAPAGCADASRVLILADSMERTRESGKALAEGMFPGCRIAVHSRSDGEPDPLFSPRKAGVGHPDSELAVAAIEGRIGGEIDSLTPAFRPQLAALDRVLSGCGHLPVNSHRTSVFDVHSTLKTGSGDPPFMARGPIFTGGTLAADLLLEYTEGFSDAQTGWGCLDGATLRELMQVDAARWEFAFRTPAVARMYASNLLDHIRSTMEQSVTGKPVPGAIGKPGDRLVILVGHDTNIFTVAGALGINWVLDGRVNDAPPGGALIFELWQSSAGEPFVRLRFTTQTLEQMRRAEPLKLSNPPAEAPVFVPGCSRADLSCTLDGFSAAMRQATDPAFVTAQP